MQNGEQKGRLIMKKPNSNAQRYASVCEFNLAFQVMSASKEANTDSHLNFYRNVHSMQEVSPNHRTSNAPI